MTNQTNKRAILINFDDLVELPDVIAEAINLRALLAQYMKWSGAGIPHPDGHHEFTADEIFMLIEIDSQSQLDSTISND